jgi:uncharacterized membrane protein YcaP (DUF421 family)
MVFNMSEIFDTIYRAVISLVVLFFITKLLGRKQVSELTLFDYVIGISIGNFSAEMTINLESNEINGIVAVLTFGIIAYAISILTMKSEKVRNYVTGPPTILIEKGNLMYKNLQKVHFDVNDLLQECRINGYFDIYQIEYALMEANGQVSFLPKKDYANITLKDMNLKKENDGLVANIIIDSKINEDNLANVKKTKEWVDRELKLKGYDSYENILLATLDKNDKFIIYEKNENKNTTDVLN